MAAPNTSLRPKARPENMLPKEEPMFEINSREYGGKEVPVIKFKDGNEMYMFEVEQMLQENKTSPEPVPGKATTKEILNFLRGTNPTKDEFIKFFTAKRANKGGLFGPKSETKKQLPPRSRAALGVSSYDNINPDATTDRLKELGQGVWESLPGIGTAYTVQDIKEELGKEDPNYYMIGALAGAEVIGLIPGLGTVAKKAIREGAKKVGLEKTFNQMESLISKPEPKADSKLIAGPGAKDYESEALEKAKDLKSRRYSPRQIEEATGRFETGPTSDFWVSGRDMHSLNEEKKYLETRIKTLKEELSSWNINSSYTKEYLNKRLSRLSNKLDGVDKSLKNLKVSPEGDAEPISLFKFEIPDENIPIELNKNFSSLDVFNARSKNPVKVRDMIPSHTELFKQYPTIGEVKFYFDPNMESVAHFVPDGDGYIVFNPNHKGFDSVNSAEFRHTFFHELQHAVQYYDFKSSFLEKLGGGPTTFTKSISGRDPFGELHTKRSKLKNPKAVELRNKMIKLFKENTRALDYTSGKGFSNPKIAKKLAKLMRDLERESFKTYMQTVSEIEAGVVGRRAQTLGGEFGPKDNIISDISKRSTLETNQQNWRENPLTRVDRLAERLKSSLTPLTKKEMEKYAHGGVNFVRYSLGIDEGLMGFTPHRVGKPPNFNKGGDVSAQMQSLMIPSADDDIRPEDYVQYREDNFTAASFAEDSWEETKKRFMDAGRIDVNPDDPAIFTAYKRAVDYLKDTGLAGLGLADTAFKYAVGSAAQVMPTEALEKRMARDLYSMPEAFAGAAGARSLTQLDDAADAFLEGSLHVARKAGQMKPDPNTLASFAGAIPPTYIKREAPIKKKLKDYGFRTDNPATKGYHNGEEWLKNKQKRAEESNDPTLLTGAITGYLGRDSNPLFINTNALLELKGASGEKRYPGESQYDLLRGRVEERGFDPEQKYSPDDEYGSSVLVGVNHKGEAFIIEGNTRVAVANDLNVPSLRVEVRYFNGAENVEGPYSPKNIIDRSSGLLDQAKKDAKDTASYFDYLNLRDMSLLQFREPISEFIETLTIPKKGMLGSEFLNQIKKNPSIPETSLQEGIIDSSKRYTKEELLGAIGVGKNTQGKGSFFRVSNADKDYIENYNRIFKKRNKTCRVSRWKRG